MGGYRRVIDIQVDRDEVDTESNWYPRIQRLGGYGRIIDIQRYRDVGGYRRLIDI